MPVNHTSRGYVALRTSRRPQLEFPGSKKVPFNRPCNIRIPHHHDITINPSPSILLDYTKHDEITVKFGIRLKSNGTTENHQITGRVFSRSQGIGSKMDATPVIPERSGYHRSNRHQDQEQDKHKTH
jgi:hypothetical protein